jgi:O-antigen/teichoic acid export membrane protein
MSTPAALESPQTTAEQSQEFRSQVGSISRHSGTFFAGTIFTLALGYGFKVYLARVLGAQALGIYALGFTLIGFVGALNSLGLVESAVRFAAVYRASNRLNELRSLLWRGGAIILLANAFFALALLKLGPIVAVRLYHSPELARYIPWFTILMLLGVFSTFYGRILAGYKQVGRRTLITNFIGSPATMLASLILISFGLNLKGYLLAQVLGSLLVIALIVSLVWKLTPVGARLNSQWPAPLQREIWSFSAAAICVLLLEFLLGQVDKAALGFFRGAREVGIYSVAASVVAYVGIILVSVNQVFSPVIADLHTRNELHMLGRLYRALAKWLLGLTLPLAITVMVFALPILRIFGHDFEAGWPILMIGTVGQLVNCGVGSVGLLLLMSGNQNRLLRVQIGMAFVITVASLAFIPRWGIVGAAIAAAITNAGTNICNLLQVRKVLGLSPFSRSYVRLVIPAGLSSTAAILLKMKADLFHHDYVTVAAALIASYLVFTGTILVTGLDEDDRIVLDALMLRIRRSIPGARRRLA